jgi:hypothetical protein
VDVRLSSDEDPVRIAISQPVSSLTDARKLELAKALIVAAYDVVPKDRSEYNPESPGEPSLELVKFMLEGVHLLLRNDVDLSACWSAICKQHEAERAAAHGAVH